MSPIPFQILVLSRQQPDLVTSGFGPFVTHGCADLAHAASEFNSQRFDAFLIDLSQVGGVDGLLQWPGLPRAVLESAVIAVGPEPTLAECLRLTQAGVREVLLQRELSADKLARTLRLTIERQRLDDAARRAYSIDLATGLPNYQQLLEHMTHLLALREREPAPMALVVLQLDGFAAVESSQGAEAANVLRRKAAVRLRASLRASDVVASIGRDMFAVLLAWMDADDDAEGVAGKLLQAASAPFMVSGQAVPVGARYGLSRFPAHGRDADSLLKRAISQVSDGGMGRLMSLGEAANDAG